MCLINLRKRHNLTNDGNLAAIQLLNCENLSKELTNNVDSAEQKLRCELGKKLPLFFIIDPPKDSTSLKNLVN